jgi:hypothetical protein
VNRVFFLNLFLHSQIPSIITGLLVFTLAWSIPAVCGEIHDAAQDVPGLEPDAFIISDNSNNSALVLKITNHSETPQTIPTEHYMWGAMRAITGSGDILIEIHLSCEIFTIGIAGESEEPIQIPSLSKLAPVTLRKGETAQISKSLDHETVQELKKNDEYPVLIRYSVGKKIAERFGFWQGTLKINKSYKSMTAK